MTKRIYTHRDFSGQLDVVASASGALFQASLDELKARDQLIVAFREALREGVPLDELSAETGMTVEAIRTLAARNLTFGEDMTGIAGTSF